MKRAPSKNGGRKQSATAVGTSPLDSPGACQERLEQLLQISSDIYWEQDENYRFTVITGGSLKASGTDAGTYLGTARWDHGAVPVGEGESWEAHKAVLEAHQPFTDFVFKRLDERNDVRYICTSGRPKFDARGRFRGYRGVARDITESRRAADLLRLEHTVTRGLSEAGSVRSAMQEIVRTMCQTLDWEVGRYFMVDERAGVMRFRGAWAAFDIERHVERWKQLTYACGEGIIGLAWSSGEPVWAADLTTDPRASRRVVAAEIGMRGAFVFPVTSAGKVLGVFGFNSLNVRKPDQRLLAAVKVIGSQIGDFVTLP